MDFRHYELSMAVMADYLPTIQINTIRPLSCNHVVKTVAGDYRLLRQAATIAC
jgi:hypothetical protein